jgi:hypothetical protein
MKKMTIMLFSILFVFTLNNAIADSIVSTTSTAGWQSWTDADVTQDSLPFWDGNSSDYAIAGNIGAFLGKVGAFASDSRSPDANYSYWGKDATSTGYDSNFYFSRDTASAGAALVLEIAGYSGSNEFGWYDVLTPSVLNPIFIGSDSPTTSKIFYPTANYGFYLKSPDGTFLTQGGGSHFAVFNAGSNVFWVGMEDLKNLGDRDWNDMVVKVSYTAVPEPSTMLLLGFGLVGLGFVKWRRANQ